MGDQRKALHPQASSIWARDGEFQRQERIRTGIRTPEGNALPSGLWGCRVLWVGGRQVCVRVCLIEAVLRVRSELSWQLWGLWQARRSAHTYTAYANMCARVCTNMSMHAHICDVQFCYHICVYMHVHVCYGCVPEALLGPTSSQLFTCFCLCQPITPGTDLGSLIERISGSYSGAPEPACGQALGPALGAPEEWGE